MNEKSSIPACKSIGDHPTSSEVHDYDLMDDDDPEVPPQFAYEAYGSEMYPEY